MGFQRVKAAQQVDYTPEGTRRYMAYLETVAAENRVLDAAEAERNARMQAAATDRLAQAIERQTEAQLPKPTDTGPDRRAPKTGRTKCKLTPKQREKAANLEKLRKLMLDPAWLEMKQADQAAELGVKARTLRDYQRESGE